MSENKQEGSTVWQTLAGIGFSLWAIFVPISAKWVVDSLERMTVTQAAYAVESARRNEMLEGRMSRFEERQLFLMQELTRLRQEMDTKHP